MPAVASAADPASAAQQQDVIKVTGNVSDEIGGVMGASIIIKGTTNGTITDMDGNFVLDAKKGDILVISFIGYATQEVEVTGAPINVMMSDDTTMLSEVVVTALGVKRERKALGYGVSEVKGDELTKAKEPNVINSLSGKVAGLVVQQTAAGPSGSTHVQLRGATEMTGNNQPLYVIDGVPLDNTNFANAGSGSGYDLGDGISAINPDDIENMTVLKGPAASALYGSRASHGVILITTKQAEKDKFSVEYNGSYTIDRQAENWDNIQQIYGQGINGQYTVDMSTATNRSWGPKADSYDMHYDFNGQTHPYKIIPDNSSGFFRTGLTAQNTAIISTHAGNTGVRFSFTDMRNKDILPNSKMSRDNFNLRVNTTMGIVDLDFTANYTREDVLNRPALGDSRSNVGKNLMVLATTFDQNWLRDYMDSDGNYANWNGRSEYDRNPYWDLYKNENKSYKDVFRLTGKAVVNVTKNFKVQGTVGTDINGMEFQDYISRSTPGTDSGKMEINKYNNRTLNAEILALYNNYWGDWSFTGTLGANMFKVDNHTTILTGMEELMRNRISITNYEEQSIQQDSYKKQINSAFGNASVGFKSTYYLEATLRCDQSSTLPVKNNVYLYPSVSGSLVFSELINSKKFLPYGKVRLSWARVGSDTDPYMLTTNYTTGKYGYSGYTLARINKDIIPNPDLKPTMTDSFEAGLEMKLFNNRLSVDFTYYNQISKDQIIRLATTSASGYNYSLQNAGRIKNEGIELAINGRAFDVNGWALDLGLNFSKNNNKVLDLIPGMDFMEIEKASWKGVTVGAMVGENFGAIRGYDVKRTSDGKVIIMDNGLPEVDNSGLKTIGNASWDWTGGFYGTLSYKNFRLSAGFDVKVGADLYSMSMASAFESGKAIETLEGRELWYASEESRRAANMSINEWRASKKCQGFVAPGVTKNEDGTYRPNDIPVDPQAYWEFAAVNMPSLFIYDNSYIKCREITFGYTFPQKWFKNKIQGLSLSFVARNPFIIWKNIPNIDPDSTYNSSGMGLEYGSMPSRRSYGFNINFKF
ncbi:MAG: SusC/RagA family TonB-linked outer membrane protein [Bacteroidales bacterium]|nr:SusC/RagA family TonB-linked outer membrane protein [Candidatus Cryptobacteroides equifaecalis]